MNPDLQSLIAYWQRALRLLDWRIQIGYVADLANSAGQAVWGLCYPVADNKTATIAIRDPHTPPPGQTTDSAVGRVEETIVHELVHLWTSVFGTQSPAEIAAEEQMVWAISGALVGAKGTPAEAKLARAMLAKFDAPRRCAIGGQMDPKLITAALDAIEQGDSAKAIELLKGIIASAAGATPADPGDAPPEAKAPPAAAPGGAAPPPAGEDDKKKDAPPPAASKTAPMAAKAPAPAMPLLRAAVASPDPILAALAVQVQELTTAREADSAAAIVAEREGILKARTDLAPGLRAMIANVATPIETARQLAAAVPAPQKSPEVGAPVLGAGQGGSHNGERSARLPPAEHADLQRRMGIKVATDVPPVRWDGSRKVFGIIPLDQKGAVS